MIKQLTTPCVSSISSLLLSSSISRLDDDIPEPKQVTDQYLRLQKKDRRRFLKADENRNAGLNKREFADFIHPEHSLRMKELVITETIEDIDKNNDGQISMDEFLGDMWDSIENVNASEPEWIKTERENFRKYRDLDHDGKLNRREVELWLMPIDYDNIQAETLHLFREADQNQVKTFISMNIPHYRIS